MVDNERLADQVAHAFRCVDVDTRVILESLRELERGAFLMVTVYGYTEEEAAALFGVDQATVSRAVGKAKKIIREVLHKISQDSRIATK